MSTVTQAADRLRAAAANAADQLGWPLHGVTNMPPVVTDVWREDGPDLTRLCGCAVPGAVSVTQAPDVVILVAKIDRMTLQYAVSDDGDGILILPELYCANSRVALLVDALDNATEGTVLHWLREMRDYDGPLSVAEVRTDASRLLHRVDMLRVEKRSQSVPDSFFAKPPPEVAR